MDKKGAIYINYDFFENSIDIIIVSTIQYDIFGTTASSCAIYSM